MIFKNVVSFKKPCAPTKLKLPCLSNSVSEMETEELNYEHKSTQGERKVLIHPVKLETDTGRKIIPRTPS